MFSEDEKKAIKKIEEFRDYYAREDIHKENFNSNENYEKALSETKQLKKYFETVLNLVTKLEKGNKKLKDNNKSLLKKLRNIIKEVKKLTKYALYKKEFTNLNKIIKEKDKQIDLMAKQIDILMNTNNEELDCFIPTDFSNINDCVKKKSCEDCIKNFFKFRAKKGE